MGKLLLGDLEKVGWVVLKCDYVITTNSTEQNYFYYLNTNKDWNKDHLWHKLHGINRQILYEIKDGLHEQRFVSLIDTQNGILGIFQSNCDVINHHLNQNYNYNFNIYSNEYKYYLPNLIRYYGYFEKDQVTHVYYKYDAKVYKK